MSRKWLDELYDVYFDELCNDIMPKISSNISNPEKSVIFLKLTERLILMPAASTSGRESEVRES